MDKGIRIDSSKRNADGKEVIHTPKSLSWQRKRLQVSEGLGGLGLKFFSTLPCLQAQEGLERFFQSSRVRDTHRFAISLLHIVEDAAVEGQRKEESC